MIIWIKFSILVHFNSLISKMSMLTLSTSCLTSSNALIHRPNIPGSYTVLFFTALNFTSITSHIHPWVLFLFCPVSSFLLELFLHWSSVAAYWAPTDLGSSYFSVISFCLFTLLMGFSRQKYWSGLSSSSLVDILSELSNMTHPSWVALQGMAHIFTELDKAAIHEISLVSFMWLWFLFCLPSEG